MTYPSAFSLGCEIDISKSKATCKGEFASLSHIFILFFLCFYEHVGFNVCVFLLFLASTRSFQCKQSSYFKTVTNSIKLHKKAAFKDSDLISSL